MSQPHSQPDKPTPDSDNTFVVELAEDTDITAVHPLDPHLQEQLERWRQHRREKLLDDRCSIKPETLKKIRIAAERLGVNEGDLLTEGFALLLQKYRDKVGDLLASEEAGGAAKPENGLPSA
jgi:hypothetical protein